MLVMAAAVHTNFIEGYATAFVRSSARGGSRSTGSPISSARD